jgi:integrase
MANIEKRITEDGNASYRVKIRIKGFPTQTATFARLTDAKDWAKITEGAIKDRRYFKNTESKKRTLGELIDKYIEDVLPNKPKSEDKQKSQLNWWKKELGEYFLVDITPALIVEHRDKLAKAKSRFNKKYSPATINRYQAALSHALTIAANDWGWLEDSPMRKVSKSKEPRGRVRFLSDDERKALLAACQESTSAYLYPVVVLALSTGMRQGEILNLAWADVNLDKQYIILHETKNGERRRVPLSGLAHAEIKKLSKIRRIDTSLLFPHATPRLKDQPFDLRKPWDDALKKAEIKDFRFHDLRHSTASYLAMNGASLAEIAEVLGHKTLQMVKRYAHLSEAHTSKVVASMNAKIFG